MEIMKLVPTGKDYLWGGTRLREEYGKKIDLTPLAETWECSVHPDGPSYVANGIYKGQMLAEVLSAHPEYLGTKVENGELPVLVKFIDAKKDLSVQVHPDDAYAREHEGDNGKTEMWYVVDATIRHACFKIAGLDVGKNVQLLDNRFRVILHDQLNHSLNRRCVKMLSVAIVVGRCGDYNKVRIGVCSLCIQCCGQVQVFLSQIFFDIVILNRRLAVIDQVHLLRDNIHSRHLMVLRKQCSN